MAAQATGTGLAWRYALPGLALSVPLVPVSVLLPSYYADDLGIGYALTGLVLLLARLGDIITDPLVGSLSDRLDSRYGRRKPLMVLGGLLAVVALFALGTPTDHSSAGFLFLWSVLLYLGWTLVAIPYQSLAAELTPDFNVRTRLTGYRELAGLCGILIAVSVPLLAAAAGPVPANPLRLIAMTTALLGALGFSVFLVSVAEPARPAPPRRRLKLNPFAASSPFRTSGLFRRLLGAWFVNGFANGLPAVLLPVYVEVVLGLGDTERYRFLFVYVVASLLGLPLWLRASRRYGKHRAWMGAMLLASLGFLPAALLGQGDGLAFLAVCVVTGLCLGADLALPPSMQADVIDVDRRDTGQDRTAELFGWWSLSAKLATALGIGLGLVAVDLGKGVDGLPSPWSVLVLYAALPVALKAIAVALMRGYPLDAKTVAAVQADLSRAPAQGGEAGSGSVAGAAKGR